MNDDFKTDIAQPHFDMLADLFDDPKVRGAFASMVASVMHELPGVDEQNAPALRRIAIERIVTALGVDDALISTAALNIVANARRSIAPNVVTLSSRRH